MKGTGKEQAFSLLEILIVLAISITVVLLTTANLEGFRKSALLADTSREIVSVLREAKAKTVSGEGGQAYKVRFTSSVYQILDSTEVVITSRIIDDDVEIVPPSSDITFEKVTGKSNGGNVVIRIKNGTEQKIVTISTLGLVTEQ